MNVKQANELRERLFSDKVYPFKRSDGFVSACCKGCPNCAHCTDVFWSYSDGIYETMCNINGEAPYCEHYVNDGTKPITKEEFNEIKRKEDEMINKIGFEKAKAIILMGGTLDEYIRITSNTK